MANEAKILELLEVQSKLLQALTAGNVASNNSASLTRPEFIMDSLAKSISEFCYDPINAITFEVWFSRYEDIFKVDGKDLDDACKVRLLMRKLNPIAHEKYASYILPRNVRDLDFETTVETLKNMFGAPESLFSARFRCLQTIKYAEEDFTSYAARVNKCCEDFKLSGLNANQFKCLVFVTGLQSPADADIRSKLLSSLEDHADLDLSKLLSGVHKFINLKKDTALIENSACASVSINALNKVKRFSFQHKPENKQRVEQQNSKPRSPCWSCGEMHFSRHCSFINHKCTQCNKIGHKEGYCNCFSSKVNKQKQNRADIEGKSQNQKKKFTPRNKAIHFKINSINHAKRRKFVSVNISIGPDAVKHKVRLQIDTGSDISIIDVSTWERLGQPGKLLSGIRAKSASLDEIKLIAEFLCEVQLNGKVKHCKIFVSKIDSLNILGTDLCELFNLWGQPISAFCSRITQPTTDERIAVIANIKQQYAKLFNEDSSVCVKAEVALHLKSDAKPVFRAKRPVAYAVLPLIEQELQRLQDRNVISPIEYSDWAAPVVVVKKASGGIRICGDYSSGLNQSLESHQYPLPLPEDIFAKISNSPLYTHIDLADAYLQVPVTPEARKILTINTHKGLFSFNRLAPGVKSAPGAFQQLMDTMLADVEGVAAYMDDIIVSGKDWTDHINNLHQVFQRLLEYNFKVKIDKCSFFEPHIKYLGHIIDKNGLKPDPDKIDRIKGMPAPTNITELRSFLGAVNYYGKFVKQMREIRAPLDNLLRENVKFEWSKACKHSFSKFKSILSSHLMLTHYNPKLPIRVAADASNAGLGACITHIFPDGTEKVISHAARSLTPAETRYSQIEKEAAALIFAVKKFHRMIYGRKFQLLTDHKPLLAIFGNKKGIPTYTANRLQRWALTLMMYDFDIKYIPTKDFGFVDVLSRLVDTKAKLNEEIIIACAAFEEDFTSQLMNTIKVLPVTFKMVQCATDKSKILKLVIDSINSGWKLPVSSDLSPYYMRRDALAVINGCLIFNDRIIIPTCLQKRILRQLHRGHPGIDRMKTVARCHVYWPKIDEDIAMHVRQCHDCASAAKSPVKTTLQSWPMATSAMERIHIDIAGPCDGKYYFVIVDSFSKWPEIFQINTITSTVIISKLTEFFARYGDCDQIVSDNGTQFTSAQFQSFMQSRGIQHFRTAPFHPQSNGQAERFVDTLKRTLKKLKHEGTSQENLETFLQTYRSTPNRNTIDFKSPAEAFIGRKIRTSLDLLKPKKAITFTSNEKQNQQFNKHHGAKNRQFIAGDVVYAKLYRNNSEHWVPGTIIERKGSVNYNVLINEGSKTKLIRSHTNQLKLRFSVAKHNSRSTNTFIESFELFNQPSDQPILNQHGPNPVIEDGDSLSGSNVSSPDFRGFQSRSSTPDQVKISSSGRTIRDPVWTKDYDLS